ncbi:MAG: LacI family DNA-binding transcriptional regulator [Lachnospiraceae bacterium]|jgi:LacI family transcriptional regulator
MKEKKATIREVAALAGVSISSVSRYLKDPKSIQPLAAYNIKNAIRELEYEPNLFAQNLKRGKSNIIGLVVPHMEYFFGRICRGVSDYFFERNYVTFICESDNDGAKERFYIQELLNQKAAGILIAPSGLNTAYLKKVARSYDNMVMIDRKEEVGCDIVLENHRENAYNLVSWLLRNKPCRQVLMLFGWIDSFNTRMCMEGSNQAFSEAGKPEEEILRVITSRRIDTVVDALAQFSKRIQKGQRPLIVAFGSDILEYVAMEIHRSYPEWIGNVDVAGFAQAGTAEKLGMQCSLVIKNPEAVGITAAELLHKKIEEGKKEETPKIYDIKVQYRF